MTWHVQIGCVFDETNVWANVQSEKELRFTTFSFHDPKSWLPLFDLAEKRLPRQNNWLMSVQVMPLYLHSLRLLMRV